MPVPSVRLLDFLNAVPLPPYVAALGWSEGARPVLLNFAAQEVGHVLIRGDTGAGKTSLMRACAVSLAIGSRQSHIQMLFLAPRLGTHGRSGARLGPLQYLPHAAYPTVSEPGRIGQVLAFLARECRYRSRIHVVKPRIIVFVERLGSLLSRVGASIEEPLHSLLEQGAPSGIHLVMSARPSATPDLHRKMAFKPLLRIDGWSVRRQPRTLGWESRLELTGELLGRGDFLAWRGEAPVRFQAAFLSGRDLHLCLDTLQRQRPPPIVAWPVTAGPLLSPTVTGHQGSPQVEGQASRRSYAALR